MRKRLFDVIFSLFCLSFLLPLFPIIACLIKLESKGPVVFKQIRVGKNGKPFYMYKFRSMYLHDQSPEELGPIKHEHVLVTKIGYFLRRFKLDEIPQFINVLRGEMSIIGPRPYLFTSIAVMTEFEKHRFDVLPGMTCWAEVNGNVELTWRDQLILDLWYVYHQTFWLDMKILGKTLLTVMVGSIKNETALNQARQFLQDK